MTDALAARGPPAPARAAHAIGSDHRGAVPLLLGNFVFLAAGYATNFYLGRALGPVDYGLFGALAAFLALANLVTASGPAQVLPAFMRGTSYDPEAARRIAVRAQVWIALALFVALLALSVPLASLLDATDGLRSVLLGALTVPAYAVFHFGLGLLAGRADYRGRSLGTVTSSLLKLGLTVAFVSAGLAVGGAIAAYGLSALFAAGVLLLAERRHRRPVSGPAPTAAALLRASAPALAFSLAFMAIVSLDVVAVRAFAAPAEAGFYAALATFAKVPMHLFAALQVTTLGAVAGARAADRSVEVAGGLRIAAALWAPALVLLLLFPAEALALGFGDAYAPGARALRVALVGVTLLAAAQVLVASLLAVSRTRAVLLVSAATLSSFLVALLATVPRFGGTGAAWSLVVAGAVALPLAEVAVRRAMGSFVPFAPLAKVAAAAGACATVALLVSGLGGHWIVAGAAGSVAYLGGLFLLREDTLLALVSR